MLRNYKSGMIDVARALISRRLKELGISMVSASRLIEMNDTYIQQFLSSKKASPRELPERQRIMLAEILKVPEDELRGPSMPISPRKYGQNVAHRKNNVVELSPVPYRGVPESRLLVESVPGPVDLPCWHVYRGDDGEFILSESAFGLVARPPALARVDDGYALMVPRNVMDPYIKEGSVVSFHPNLAPRVGDTCVFRSLRDGVIYVQGAEYLGETADTWKARHNKPAREFTMKKSEWQTCHRAVAIYLP